MKGKRHNGSERKGNAGLAGIDKWLADINKAGGFRSAAKIIIDIWEAGRLMAGENPNKDRT